MRIPTIDRVARTVYSLARRVTHRRRTPAATSDRIFLGVDLARDGVGDTLVVRTIDGECSRIYTPADRDRLREASRELLRKINEGSIHVPPMSRGGFARGGVISRQEASPPDDTVARRYWLDTWVSDTSLPKGGVIPKRDRP